MKSICVIGSLNVDVFMTADHFPRAGENVVAHDFRIFTGGGKGANQAFALGRLGADVSMVGKIGEEFYGPRYLEVMRETHVNCDLVGIEPGFPGVGIVAVDRTGENSIYVYPGANGLVDVAHIEKEWDRIAAHDIFLFQLEIPIETTLHAMQRVRAAGKTVIFDPAPAQDIPDGLLTHSTIVTPNSTELENLTRTTTRSPIEVHAAARMLLERGAATTITKSGRHGAFITTDISTVHVPGFKVDTVDTTAAGDSFNAGLALALGRGDSLTESVRFANAVAALSTTALGAQNAMPTMDEVNAFIADQPIPPIETVA
jgi:ribokinase